ncbi:acyl-homoserine-lactone synthase [Phaeobacter sp.]|uniref:acyl-homoserine-lactone synthase n=1 Tax=Phaeobacter sp. TaxID=1902409 RepID=UPI0025CE1B21|nr:acyl-homoserine-lactone synthase [Phaeobacter sp.]
MFITIQPHEVANKIELVMEVFKLRKKIFADQLNWEVPVKGELEIDTYDAENASYFVWCSDDGKILYGCVRLMTTAGPTLLHDVFGRTHGFNDDLKQHDVWEGTRMCVDEDAISRDFPDMDPGSAFSLLLLGLCEVGLYHGINRLVSNFEPCMSRVYRRAGLKYDMHGKADGYGKRPVCCASFAVNETVLDEMRAKLSVDLPLYRAPATATRLVSPDNSDAPVRKAN